KHDQCTHDDHPFRDSIGSLGSEYYPNWTAHTILNLCPSDPPPRSALLTPPPRCAGLAASRGGCCSMRLGPCSPVRTIAVPPPAKSPPPQGLPSTCYSAISVRRPRSSVRRWC